MAIFSLLLTLLRLFKNKDKILLSLLSLQRDDLLVVHLYYSLIAVEIVFFIIIILQRR